MRQNRHEVVQNAGDLSKHCADPLGSLGNLDVEQLLDSKREALLIRHHRHVVQSVKVGQRLEVGLVLDQLFRATVEQADMGVRPNDFLAIEFEDQAQDTVGCRVLGAEIDSVVANFAVLDGAFAGLLV